MLRFKTFKLIQILNAYYLDEVLLTTEESLKK